MNPCAKVRKIFIYYLLAISALTVVALSVVYVRGVIFNQPYPFNSLLYDPDIRFFDITIFDMRFWSFLRSGDFFGPLSAPYAYPAPAVFATLPFYMVSDNAVVPFLVFMLTAIWLATYLVWLYVRGNAGLYSVVACVLLLTTATSYPFYFLLDRGNIEGLIWVVLALGLASFAAGRYWLSAFLIGAAASMKPFPGVLLLLLLARRKYREFIFGGLTFVALNLAAMRALSGSVIGTWEKLAAAFGGFAEHWAFAYRSHEIGVDHSLFSVLKQFVHLKQKYPALDHTMESIHLYYFVLVYGAFAAGYLLYFRRLPILNQLFLFVIASTLFPYVAYDYTLVQVYIPWTAFLVYLCTDVASGRADLTQAQALRILLPCAVIFTPQTYLIIAKGIGCGGQVKALALMALMHAAITIPMPSSLFRELPASEDLPLTGVESNRQTAS
jgi:hypothetical protein